MPDPTPTTIPLPTLPHSGLCDAPRGGWCTCAAGLLRLIGGAECVAKPRCVHQRVKVMDGWVDQCRCGKDMR